MNRLAHIVRSEIPSTSVQFRRRSYGKDGVQDFLRDVLAMANASIEGPRYIITGAEFDGRGRKRLYGVEHDDFAGKPAYQALANEHIEPPVRIRYQPVTVDGQIIGVFQMGDCQDRPYMMRVDYSETLRRGDAYARVNDAAIKLGRRQLQKLFELKFQDSMSAANIEVGFPGQIIHKDLRVPTCSLAELPSAIASSKLYELIDAKNRVQASAANTMVARLTHARLFGTDSPYEERSAEEIMQDIAQIERRYSNHDNHFLFEERATSVQLVLYNQGEDTLNDTSISLVMPNHSAFHVATALPKVPSDGSFIDRTAGEQSEYPAVTLHDDAIQVTAKPGDIPPGEPVDIFGVPLRICAGPELKDRRIGIQYSIHAHNLRTAAKGKLRLLFQ